MAQKNLRLKEIRDIIQNQKISRQDQLLNILHRRGFDITQATLSRDLTALHIARKATEEGTVYFIPEGEEVAMPETTVLYGARSLQFAQNLGVLKTLPGYANSVAAIIDSYNFDHLLGTVAGNDTVLLILDHPGSSGEFKKELSDNFSNVESILN